MAVGDQQCALVKALCEAGFESAAPPASLRIEMLPAEAQAQVFHLYRALGGVQDQPALTPTGWDCPLADGLVVELDELQHFNRYRATTLDAAWALQLPWRTDYLRFCAVYEADCLRTTGSSEFWSTPQTVSMFGTPAPGAKTLDGVGSPRWKQRALYDAMRDIAALHGVVRLARVSIFDDVGGTPLGMALSGAVSPDSESLTELIAQRTAVVT